MLLNLDVDLILVIEFDVMRIRSLFGLYATHIVVFLRDQRF
jgi:hypothetical protein